MKATILCIEDEITLCEDIAEELVEAGYKALQAHDGRKGLDAILKYKPDLVICDITMPCMTGHQLLVELREKYPETSLTPFIFLSAQSDRRDILKGIRLGADDYLTKPVDYEMLLAKVEAKLRRSQLPIEKPTFKISDLLRHLDEIQNIEEIGNALQNHLSKYGCEYLCIGGVPMPGKDIERMCLIKKFPKGAWEHYIDNNFIQADPLFWHGLTSHSPFHWHEAPLIKGREQLGKKFLNDFAQFGMKEGFIVPIIEGADVQFIASFSGKHVFVPKDEIINVSILMHYAFNRLRVLNGEKLKRSGELSPREREVVQWVAFGKTTRDIAQILGISSRTVVMHLQNASDKLHAINRTNLVAEAIRYKQITI